MAVERSRRVLGSVRERIGERSGGSEKARDIVRISVRRGRRPTSSPPGHSRRLENGAQHCSGTRLRPPSTALRFNTSEARVR